ncbi:MAG: S8 family peptidase [Caldilineaceae bacterium]
MLFLTLSGAVPLAPQTAFAQPLQPLLRQLAIEEPDLVVEVIVQKSSTASNLEETIVDWGGEITRDLHIIHGFSARLPAKRALELAELGGVRWISLNGGVYKSSLLDVEGSVTLREEFDDTGNEPTTMWTGLGTWSGQAWQEIGENDGPASGDVAVTRFFGGELSGLRLQNGNKGLVGFAALSDASKAVLSYAFRRKDLDDASDFVSLQVSADGGTTWTEVDRFSGPMTDASVQFHSVDISLYASQQTAIRFLTSPTFDDTDKFYVDFVQLEFVGKPEGEKSQPELSNRLFLPLISADTSAGSNPIETMHNDSLTTTDQPVAPAEISSLKNVCDQFYAGTYEDSCGGSAEAWASSWVENEVSSGGVGATSGHIRVENYGLRLDNYPATGGQPSVSRKANLGGGVVAASMDVLFETSAAVTASDTAVIEVSKDGGTTYTALETVTGITGASRLKHTYNISRFASPNFMVRFRIQSNYSSVNKTFTVRLVNISYERIDSGVAWQYLIPTYADGWKYLADGSNQGTAWRAPEFNDSTWATGKAEFGYGNGFGQDTQVTYGSDPNNKYITTYFRRSLFIPNTSDLSSLSFRLLSDDGGVVYVNGVELFRYNMPTGAITSTTRAATNVTGAVNWYVYNVNNTMLVNGENTIAVEVHQAIPNTDDMVFNFELWGYSTCTDCINTTSVTNSYVKTIRATDLWNGTTRLQGQGVTVAVVDSGISNHQDTNNAILNQRVLTHVNFSSDPLSIDDENGHGSHIAGTIAGNGAKSQGKYLGVAPRANLVDVKVTNDQGSGTTADVVEGIQWIYDNKNTYNIRVANLSLNSTIAESYNTSPLDAALEILWFNGVTVIVSAGNNGTTNGGVLYPPANDPFVITVGAVDDKGTTTVTDDVIPTFSAYGITSDGFAKPDLVAPGSNIISLLASDDSNLAVNHPANVVSGPYGSYYFRMSGTSMASAVASGAVALLIQDEPGLTPDQIKYRLRATANKNWTAYSNQKAGAGTLDIYAAVNGTSTQSSNTGLQASQLLSSGGTPINWGSVNWNSVNWNSVNWNSVNWNSVNWNSVNWNSNSWEE